MNNKRGQGMSTNAIILIILGIVVLVVLILGFTMGWDKLAPWFSKNNVDTIVIACEASCSINGIYDFCMMGRDLKAEDTKLKGVTCNYLSKHKTEYGIGACSSIECDNVFIAEDAGSVEQLESYCSEHEGKIIQALIADTLESRPCS